MGYEGKTARHTYSTRLFGIPSAVTERSDSTPDIEASSSVCFRGSTRIHRRRVSQDLDAATQNHACDDQTDSQVRPAGAGEMDERSGEDDAGVGDDVVLGKDPARPHVDLAFSMLGEKSETGNVGDQCGNADAEHKPEIGIAAVDESADDVEQHPHRERDLEPAAEARRARSDSFAQ